MVFDYVFGSLVHHHRQRRARIMFLERPQHRRGEEDITDIAQFDDKDVLQRLCGPNDTLRDLDDLDGPLARCLGLLKGIFLGGNEIYVSIEGQFPIFS